MGNTTTTDPTPAEAAGEGNANSQADTLTLEQQEEAALDMILAEQEGDGSTDSAKENESSRENASPKQDGPEQSEAPSDTDEPEANADDSSEDQDEGTPEEGQDDEASVEDPGESDQSLAPDVEANYKKRVASAQQKMHEATQELAAERKAREALEARLLELEEKVDSGPQNDLLEDFTKDLDEGTAALLDDTPELKTAFGQLLNRLNKLEGNVDEKVNEVLHQRERLEEAQTVAQKERDWRISVMEQEPDLFETAESPEWQEWVSTHQETYKTIVGKYDQFDPRNALDLYAAFRRDTGKGGPATSRSDEAASAALGLKKTNGRRGSTKSTGPAPKSYKQMEQDALDQILAEEKANAALY